MQARETATPYQPSKKTYTYADYVQLPDDGMRYEIIEGELFITPAPTPIHQRIIRKLLVKLDNFVEKSRCGEVLMLQSTWYSMKKDIVQPDIIFIAREKFSNITEKNIQGAPELIIEILSPGTAYNELVNKKDLYAKFDVNEYWIVDPHKQWIEIYTLTDKEYTLHQRAVKSGKVSSVVLNGFQIFLKDIFSYPSK